MLCGLAACRVWGGSVCSASTSLSSGAPLALCRQQVRGEQEGPAFLELHSSRREGLPFPASSDVP